MATKKTEEGSEKLTLLQKLLCIQKEVIGLLADAKGMNYKYVDGDKVISYIKPLMNSYGLLLIPKVIETTNTRQDYELASGKKKNEIFTSLKMEMCWIDTDTGSEYAVPWSANGMNDWDKGFGSALTYSERYFFLKFFHIQTDRDDIDNPESKIVDSHNLTEKNISIDEKIKLAKNKIELDAIYNSLDPNQQSYYAGILTGRLTEINTPKQ